MCYCNLSRDYTFQKYNFIIKLCDANKISNSRVFVLLLCSGMIMVRFQKPEIVARKSSTSNLCV